MPYKDETGKVFDFHSFRGQFATLLNKAGTPLVTAQKMMRHSKPDLTANYYTDVFLADKAEEVEKLPAQMLDLTLPKIDETEGENRRGDQGEDDLTDRQTDRRNPDSDGQIRTYTNKNDDGKNAALQFLERFPELQHIDIDRDKGAILLFPPMVLRKMAVGNEETLIPQGDKGSEKLAPPAGFTKGP